MCIYHTLNITEWSDGRRQLTATFAKCNLTNETLSIPIIIYSMRHNFFLREALEKTLSDFRYITEKFFFLYLNLIKKKKKKKKKKT